MTALKGAHQARKGNSTLTVVGYSDNRTAYIAPSESSEPKLWNKVEKKYNNDQNNTTATATEHRFCRQNRPERCQVQDWHPNEKMVVVPVCVGVSY